MNVTNTDKFSVYYLDRTLVLRCDVCHAIDMFDGAVCAWSVDEDVNLSALVSHAQAHWAKIHATEEVNV